MNTAKRFGIYAWLVILCTFAQNTFVYSQEKNDSTKQEPWFSVSGSATLTGDFYDFTSTPDGSQKGRRPSSLYRFIFSPTIKIGDFISIPLNFLLTTPETNTTTPTITNPSFSQYLQNPANAFGISSITPSIGWAKFYLGSHTPQYSELSGGDLQLFGGGIDLRPGAFRFAASAGTSQRAVESDYTKGIQGAYRTDVYMGRISLGNEDSTFVGLNAVYSRDSRESVINNITAINIAHAFEGDPLTIVPADTVRLRAQEGFVGSVNAKAQIAEGISIKGEGAISSFTRDLSSNENNIEGNILNSIQTSRTSTRVDIAGNAEILISKKIWGIKFSGLYMGAGFVPMGYPFAQSDKFDLKISPNLRLFEGDLSINGSVGNRINNLSGTKGETLSQLIANAYINATITEEFSIGVNYSNFGIRNNRQNDTLKIENVSSSLSFDPSLMLVGEKISHLISATFSLDKFEDYNVISGVLNSNDTKTIMTNYNITFIDIGANLGAAGSYVENNLPIGALIMRSVTFNAAIDLLERTLTPALGLTVGSSTIDDKPTDSQLFAKIGLKWKSSKFLSLTVNYGMNSYSYGDPIPRGASFDEQIIQFAVSSNF